MYLITHLTLSSGIAQHLQSTLLRSHTHTHTHVCTLSLSVTQQHMSLPGNIYRGKEVCNSGTCSSQGDQSPVWWASIYRLPWLQSDMPPGDWNLNAGLGNLWQVQRFPWHVAFTADPIFFISFTQAAALYSYECVYIHVSDCVRDCILLPNDTASETFLHKSGVMPSVDWVFITGSDRTNMWHRTKGFTTFFLNRK